MSRQKNDPDVRFWLSRKFWMAVISAAVFTVLAASKAVVFSSSEVMTFVLGLAGISIGGHVVTDIASLVTSVVEGKREPVIGAVSLTTTENVTVPAGTTVSAPVGTGLPPLVRDDSTVSTPNYSPPTMDGGSRGRG